MSETAEDTKEDLAIGTSETLNSLKLFDNSIAHLRPIVDPAEQVEMLFGDGSELPGGKYLTLCRVKDGQFRHHFIPRENVGQELLQQYVGVEDAYIGMQPSYFRSRRSEHISQLRCLYVDLDHYNMGMSFYDVWMELHEKYFGTLLPYPNAINSTGRGTLLIYLIEPESTFRRDIWAPVMDHFIRTCMPLGADVSCNDMSRVFRLVGTKNSKNGEMVQMFRMHSKRYNLRDLMEKYVPEPEEPVIKRRRNSSPDLSTVPEALRPYVRSLKAYNIRRVLDLRKLSELRGGDMDGRRHYMMFLTRLHALLGTDGNDKEAQEAMRDLNDTFLNPKDLLQVERETRTAIHSYNRYVKEGKKGLYTYSTGRLVRDFSVTPEEQEHLQVIIGPGESTRRHSGRKRRQRRSQGVQPRDQYLLEQEERKQTNTERLGQAMKENPGATNSALAGILGVSLATVKRWKKELH